MRNNNFYNTGLEIIRYLFLLDFHTYSENKNLALDSSVFKLSIFESEIATVEWNYGNSSARDIIEWK